MTPVVCDTMGVMARLRTPNSDVKDWPAYATHLKNLLTGVVVAAGRMRDDWAEGDDARKKELWQALHTAADAAEDEVYPLAPLDDSEVAGGAPS